MIFMNNMLMVYTKEVDPMKANQFAQQVLILGAQYRGEIPNE